MTNIKLDNNHILTFKAISDFINDLSEEYGKQLHSLALYSRLISKTTFNNKEPILKHINIFQRFCSINEKGILNNNISEFNSLLLKYTDKIYINLELIFKWSDNNVRTVILQHLQTIYALIDPSSKAKKILNESKNKNAGKNTNEEDLINGLMNTIQNSVDPNEVNSPVDAIQNMMSNPSFMNTINNMTSSIDNGDIDPTKLMGLVQGMISQMGSGEEIGEIGGMVNMVTGLMGGMGMSSNNDKRSIEEQINDKYISESNIDEKLPTIKHKDPIVEDLD